MNPALPPSTAALITAVLACAAASSSRAADVRWSRAYAQGTVEAIIHNETDSSVNIYCPLGQLDTTPGMFVQSAKVSPVKDEQVRVQIIVDGKTHAFVFNEIQFLASGRTKYTALSGLVRALIRSKAKQFVVDFPKYKLAERFSLRGARRALADGRGTMLDHCPL